VFRSRTLTRLTLVQLTAGRAPGVDNASPRQAARLRSSIPGRRATASPPNVPLLQIGYRPEIWGSCPKRPARK